MARGAATTRIETMNSAILPTVSARPRSAMPPAAPAWPPPSAARHVGEGWQQHERQHHHQVLTISQPTASRPSALSSRLRSSRPQAAPRCWPRTGRARTPAPAPAAQPHAMHRTVPQHRRGRSAPARPAPRCRDRHQVADREMQADTEHQQDDADLGELAGSAASATKPGVNGPTTMPASR